LSDCSRLITDLNTKSWSDSNCLVVIIFTSAGDLVTICVAQELNSVMTHNRVIIFFIFICSKLISSGYDGVICNDIVFIKRDNQVKRFAAAALASALPGKEIG